MKGGKNVLFNGANQEATERDHITDCYLDSVVSPEYAL